MKRYFHLWFSTKGRKVVLEGDVEQQIRRSFESAAKEKQICIVELELNFDHAHLLMALPDIRQVPWALKQLKGRSAYEVFRAIPDLKLDMHSNAFWQKGYGFREVLPNQVEAVRRYIRTQKDRPHQH